MLHCSHSNEEREGCKHHAHHNKRGNASNEIRDADEKQPSKKWNESALPATVDAIPCANRAEEQTQKKKRSAHSFWRGLTFELSRLRRLAKPAVAGRLQRRVRTHFGQWLLATQTLGCSMAPEGKDQEERGTDKLIEAAGAETSNTKCDSADERQKTERVPAKR